MFKNLLIFSVLVCGAFGFWFECRTPGSPSPNYVTSDACDYERCSVNRGDRLFGSVYFTPESAYTAINVTTDAYIYGMWTELEYEYPLNDVCQALFRGDQQVSCPTEPHQEYRWNLDFLINPVIPQLSNVPIQFNFRDDTGSVVVCFEIYADIW